MEFSSTSRRAHLCAFKRSCPKIVASWVSTSQLDMAQNCGDCLGLTWLDSHSVALVTLARSKIPRCSAMYRSASAQRIFTFASTCPVAVVYSRWKIHVTKLWWRTNSAYDFPWFPMISHETMGWFPTKLRPSRCLRTWLMRRKWLGMTFNPSFIRAIEAQFYRTYHIDNGAIRQK